MWRCKKGHTFRKLTAQLTGFEACCEIKRLNREWDESGSVRDSWNSHVFSIVNILSPHLWIKKKNKTKKTLHQTPHRLVHFSLVFLVVLAPTTVCHAMFVAIWSRETILFHAALNLLRRTSKSFEITLNYLSVPNNICHTIFKSFDV